MDERTPPQWQDQPPAGPWLPPELEALCGETLGDVCTDPAHFVCEPALPGWRVLAGTRRGRLHAHRGTYREDAFAHGGDREDGRFWVFCVCDGAGSSRLSRVGAEITARGMVQRLSGALRAQADSWAALSVAELHPALGAAVVEAARRAVDFLGEAAAAAGAEPKDFRCTLLLTILYRHGDRTLACLSQVGDGFIAGLN
ncbi:MAG: protein phosphatase 2C domain-containing protein, partial [Caulobacteraceae bacterium]|nr:protein phosphatase 2C domain-containing protein [Caulobacter sp.]